MPSAPTTRSAVTRDAVFECQGGTAAIVDNAGQAVVHLQDAFRQHAQQGIDEVAAMHEMGSGAKGVLFRPLFHRDPLAMGQQNLEIVAWRRDGIDRIKDAELRNWSMVEGRRPMPAPTSLAPVHKW